MSTNPEPQPAEFDPDEELTHLGDAEQKLYGLPTRTFFYLIESCRQIEAFAAPVFTIDPVFGPPGLTRVGCRVEFIVRRHAFWVDTHRRVKLSTSSADDPDGIRNRYLVFDGQASDPKAWEGLLQKIGRVEKFGVLIPHADTLRRMWTEWLAAQRDRGDERGW